MLVNSPFGYRSYEFENAAVLTNGMRECRACSLLAKDRDTTVWAEDLDKGQRVVFKVYHNRGPISWWRESKFRFRVQREFEALSKLEQKGIPCSTPLYWSYGISSSLGRCELLATREIPNAVPLCKFIDGLEIEQCHKTLANLFAQVREMHQQGIYHGVLDARNILISRDEEDKFEFHIIDLPMSMFFPYDISGTRMAKHDLLNLSLQLRRKFGTQHCQPFFSEYGLSGQELRKMINKLASYQPNKHLRNWFRTEFRAKELVSNLLRTM